ncbi:MAG: hemerythrin domain-containing protein [Terriglobales bacterium]
MLFQIQTLTPGPGTPGPGMSAGSLAAQLRGDTTSDAVALLLGCHARIRHFTQLAVRLAQPDASAELIPEAAAGVHRYYSQALPLHEADENDSVYPRLAAAMHAAAPGEAALAAANQAMVEQHRVLNQLIAQLVPEWQAMQAHPETAVATAKQAAQLEQAWEQHLALEESVIFPALERYLSLEDRTAIRLEMVERRKLASNRPAVLTPRSS